jgi:hypothetical protein
VIAVALAALVASPALAQRRPRGPRGGGSGYMWLGQKSVQEELKLSDDQVKQVKEQQDKSRKAFEGLRDLSREERGPKIQELMKENEKAYAKILDKKQTARLKQIGLQLSLRFQGAGVLSNPDVAKKLELTDDQKKGLKTIQDDIRKEAGEIFQGEGTREEKFKKVGELQKTATAKALKLLTDDQRKTWKEMTGAEFKGKIEMPRFGGGRGRGN